MRVILPVRWWARSVVSSGRTKRSPVPAIHRNVGITAIPPSERMIVLLPAPGMMTAEPPPGATEIW
jgi:hypothetical protein